MLRTGTQWKDFPDRCPAYQACHRRFQKWSRNGTMRTIICSLAKDLRKCGKIDIENHLWMEHSFLQKKGPKSRKTKAWEGYKDHGQSETVISFCIENASPHEVTLR
ncbi:transposase [Leptospira santarosai]|uniref:transposase n=1 Tax=Leptospira santarosai TaxID=28183 RepID=UPI001E5B860E|nr:transposase [Leptospira santarosai]